MTFNPLTALAATSLLPTISSAIQAPLKLGAAGFADMLKAATRNTQASDAPGAESPEAKAGGTITVDEIRAKTSAATEAFKEKFRQLLTAQGIPLDEPVELEVDMFGKVCVAGEHPARDAIDALLAENDDLNNQFRLIAANSSLLDAIDQAGLSGSETFSTKALAERLQRNTASQGEGDFRLRVEPAPAASTAAA